MIVGYAVLGIQADGILYVANGGTIYTTESEAGKAVHLFNRHRVPGGVVYAVCVITHGDRDLLPAELQ